MFRGSPPPGAGSPAVAAPVVAPAPDSNGSGGDAPRLVAAPSSTNDGKARRYKARQVQRVVTRVDPWTVLKVSLLLAVCLWLIIVVAGVILWQVAVVTGTIGRFENFMAQLLAENSFTIDGTSVFVGSAVAGAVLLTCSAVFSVIGSVLFNLISTLTGGVRCTVVELETARPVDGA